MTVPNRNPLATARRWMADAALAGSTAALLAGCSSVGNGLAAIRDGIDSTLGYTAFYKGSAFKVDIRTYRNAAGRSEFGIVDSTGWGENFEAHENRKASIRFLGEFAPNGAELVPSRLVDTYLIAGNKVAVVQAKAGDCANLYLIVHMEADGPAQLLDGCRSAPKAREFAFSARTAPGAKEGTLLATEIGAADAYVFSYRVAPRSLALAPEGEGLASEVNRLAEQRAAEKARIDREERERQAQLRLEREKAWREQAELRRQQKEKQEADERAAAAAQAQLEAVAAARAEKEKAAEEAKAERERLEDERKAKLEIAAVRVAAMAFRDGPQISATIQGDQIELVSKDSRAFAIGEIVLNGRTDTPDCVQHQAYSFLSGSYWYVRKKLRMGDSVRTYLDRACGNRLARIDILTTLGRTSVPF